jgi:hypothetical protein
METMVEAPDVHDGDAPASRLGAARSPLHAHF